MMQKTLNTLIIIFLALPLAALLYLSAVKFWVYPDLLHAHFSLEFWSGLGGTYSGLTSSFALSLLMATSISLTATGLGFFFSAFLLLVPGRSTWLALSFFPYLIAPVSFGALLQTYFVRFGLSGSTGGVWIAQLLFVLPYANILLSTFWNRHIRQLYQQAITLGARPLQAFSGIILPLAKPWLGLSLLQCFLISWYEYGITRLIGIGKVQTLTVGVMHYLNEANPHVAALAAILLVSPVVLLGAISYIVVGKLSLQV
jgi:putative spermidine/putrescine transport system permease protein